MMNIDKSCTLSQTCADIKVSPSHLSRVVKNEFGVGFSEYINLSKVTRAKRLLLSTPLTVGDIAEQLGYGSANYFSRVFKKYTGFLPSKYRENEKIVR